MRYRNQTLAFKVACRALVFISLTVFFIGPNPRMAQSQPSSFQVYGPGIVFDDQPNVFFLIGDIRSGDYFEVRRYLRQHDVDYFVLSSPGGDVWEALQISGMVHDLEIPTVVLRGGTCASACSFIFFAGQPRLALGSLGVHQFSTTAGEGSEANAQFTTSEIIAFLNEYSTPPFVFEHMFRSNEMYFFDRRELQALSTVAPDSFGLNFEAAQRKVTDFLNELSESIAPQPENDPSIPPETNAPEDVIVIHGSPPVTPAPRPTERVPSYITITDQTSLDRLRILISRATLSYEQPQRSSFRGEFPIDSGTRGMLIAYVARNLPDYNLRRDFFVEDLSLLVSDENLPLSIDNTPNEAALLRAPLRNSETHGAWISGQGAGSNCFMLTQSSTDANPNTISAVPIVALGVRCRAEACSLSFAAPFPNVLERHSMQLAVDGRQVRFVISQLTQPFFFGRGSTIAPRPIGENLVSTEIVWSFSRGSQANIIGINQMTGEENEFRFSLHGFTSAFRRMVSICDAPELLDWLP
ncbi:MAG: hypothetical protein ACMUJJ_15700 [Roseicyclus sp.]|uniref:hypothetical protein n=1 Tax=Roseicyclus sp. TaxID=1914329 RepID=UPI003A85CDFE